MKTGTIIAAMTAMAVYGLTIAIAVDQVKVAKKSERETGAKLVKSGILLREAQAELRKAQGQKAAAEEKVQLAVSGIDRMKLAADEMSAAYQREIAFLKKTNEIRQTLNQALTSTVPTVSATVSAKVNLPRWIPEAPQVVARKIKDRATREHGNDFSAAKYEIEWQTEAHEKLLRYHKMNNMTVNDILAKAAFEKGEDFRGMVWEVERQLDAAKVIQTR